DVVSGKFTPKPLAALAADLPEVHARLIEGAQKLERAGRDAQDIEFTIERGRLYFLQSRAAKLAPHAAARIAVDLVREGLIDEAAALQRVTPDQVRLLLSPHLPERAARAPRPASASESSLAIPTRPSAAPRPARRWCSRARRRARKTCTG